MRRIISGPVAPVIIGAVLMILGLFAWPATAYRARCRRKRLARWAGWRPGRHLDRAEPDSGAWI